MMASLREFPDAGKAKLRKDPALFRGAEADAKSQGIFDANRATAPEVGEAGTILREICAGRETQRRSVTALFRQRRVVHDLWEIPWRIPCRPSEFAGLVRFSQGNSCSTEYADAQRHRFVSVASADAQSQGNFGEG